MKDKVTLTIELERNTNGTVGMSHKIEGEGFYFFEILGLMEIVKARLIQDSREAGEKAPTDKGVIRNQFLPTAS